MGFLDKEFNARISRVFGMGWLLFVGSLKS